MISGTERPPRFRCETCGSQAIVHQHTAGEIRSLCRGCGTLQVRPR